MACALALLAGCGQGRAGSAAGRAAGPPPASAAAPGPPPPAPIPRQLLAQARPIGRGPRFRPSVTGPVVGRCSPALGPRFGVHVEVFGANRVVIVPAGIGIRGRVAVTEGRISSAGCYGSLATLEPTGLVLARPRAALSLGDLFRAWGEPLSPRRLASFGGHTTVFVNGRRWPGPPGEVPLRRHAEIVAEVGPYVPPHASYAFPPGT